MERKKKLLVIGLLAIGIIIVIISCVVFKNHPTNNNPSNTNNSENNHSSTNESEKETEISTFSISKFEVDKSVYGQVNLFFKLINQGKEAIKDKYLDIRMYDGKTLLYTYGYLIETLETDESIYVEATAKFSYKNISTYEFVIDDKKVIVEPVYIEL